MLTFQDRSRQTRNWHRCQFRRAGGFALGGLTLVEIFAHKSNYYPGTGVVVPKPMLPNGLG